MLSWKRITLNLNDDILEKLLTLNLDLAEKENKGDSIIGPWCP